ncbi:MAG TPA: phage portal protein [Marinobacter sp.]|uniref:Phage portal protein n=1 Tax=marine sediment metagenome TaxID=412755 RepID=A0A0F9F584_9ZZZZ|nr:phage portal protein [Marinobacter sp.]
MSILNRLGWQSRKAHTLQGRAPAWVSSYARSAELSSDVVDSWSALPEAGSYKLAAERYMVSDLVYMCVSKLASMASSCQLVLFDPDGERDPLTGLPLDSARIERKDHPFYALWDRPNPFDSRPEFIEAIVTTLLLSPKGVFVHLDDGRRPKAGADKVKNVSLRGSPRALWWILPEPMTVKPDEETFIGSYSFAMAGERTVFTPEAIMRITAFHPLNRYHSLSRVVPANLASAADVESQKTGFSMFKNGFRPSAIVESDRDRVDPDELKLMEKLWNEQQVGSENFHKLFPIWAGFKIKEYGFSPRDSESVDIAKLNRERVFGVFGVHPGLVLGSDINLANAQIAEHATRAWTLMPIMARLAGEITFILPHWPDAPPAEAHFVNVVPADLKSDAETEQIKASSVHQRSQAVSALTLSLGLEAGVKVAKVWGILPDDMEIIVPVSETESAEKAMKAGSIGQRDALIAAAEGLVRGLANDLVNDVISLHDWVQRMRTDLWSIFEAQYRLGFGRLDSQGQTEVNVLLSTQFGFLSEFTEEIEDNPEWSSVHIGARAFQYFGASVQAYEAASVRAVLSGIGSIDLPEMPADGDQICLSRCQCHWRIVVLEDNRAACYWTLDLDAEHCDSCLENAAKWKPLVLPITPGF